MTQPPQLTGIIPPIPTPITDDERVDEASLARLVEHVIAGGVSGLFVLGTTGEFAALTNDAKQRVLDVVARTVGGRVKMVVNVSDTSLPRVLPVLRMAEAAGADAIALLAPYYYPMDLDEEILAHYRFVSQETDLPILVYNFPKMTKVTVRPELVADLIETANVCAIKDSSAEMIGFRDLIALSQRYEHFSALLAPLPLISMAATYGADGVVTGMGNVAPRLVCDLFEAAKAGQIERAAELQRQADRLVALFQVGKSFFAPVQGIKSALKLMGIFSTNGFVRPFRGHDDAQVARVREVIEKEGLL